MSPSKRILSRLFGRRLQGAVFAVLGLLSSVGQPAYAFDIPTPQNQPKTINTTPFGVPQDFGPVTPLPPITDLNTQSGAGRLPAGMTVQTQITPTANGLLERAPFLVTLTITDRNKTLASLTLHRPYGEHIQSDRIDINQQLRSIDGRMANVRVYRFAVTPLAAGEIELKFAEMTFREVGDSDTRYAFIPVARTLTVRPLPGFWPAYLPVTPNLSISQEPLPKLAAGQPVDWVLHITGQNLTAFALNKLLDEQLIGTAALGVGRAEIRRATEDKPPVDDPLAETFSVRISLLPDPQGQGATTAALPRLRLPFIDSRESAPGQQLSETVLPARSISWPASSGVRVLDAVQFWWWRVLLLLMFAYGLGFALNDARKRWQRRRQHRAAQVELAELNTPRAVLHRLRQLTGESSIKGMIERAPNPRFIAALQALDAACYGNSDGPISEKRLENWPQTHQELVRWLPRVFFNAARPTASD
ncbi:hypothetical protein [Halothiobacillus sp. 15-55-196]|uniref:hypothetical protein n=1 Tax=Halothiobacillus sp. 15-55-196 TaxID=1970382 RepID=UPI0025C2A06E|nr:hypothetical protein [Halothiobacillus sp. 15-55-196]